MKNRFDCIARTRAAAVLGACFWLSACASAPALGPVSITEVNDHIDEYKGKVVAVRGYFVQAPPHQYMFWSEGPEAIASRMELAERTNGREGGIGGRVRECMSVINYGKLKLRGLGNQWLTITGKVLAAAPEEDVVFNMTGCEYWTSIWMNKVDPPGEIPASRKAREARLNHVTPMRGAP